MLWEMAAGLNNEYRLLVQGEEDADWSPFFRTNGEPLAWQVRPKVEPFTDPRRKKQKQRGDVEYITWGALVLNQRAHSALRDKFLPFGQFLELDCLGETCYFYNVTNIVAVVDYAASGKTGAAVTQPRFTESAIPTGFCIFKDKLTVKGAIYTNDHTKAVLTEILMKEKLTGLYFIPAGSL
jgi:hypothetical protein